MLDLPGCADVDALPSGATFFKVYRRLPVFGSMEYIKCIVWVYNWWMRQAKCFQFLSFWYDFWQKSTRVVLFGSMIVPISTDSYYTHCTNSGKQLTDIRLLNRISSYFFTFSFSDKVQHVQQPRLGFLRILWKNQKCVEKIKKKTNTWNTITR